MRTTVKRVVPALAVASMVFFAGWACQPKDPDAPDVTDDGELHVVEFYDELSPTGELIQRRVKKIKAQTGDRLKFTAEDRTVWVLIPRAKIERTSGGADWAKGDSFIAFKIEKTDESTKGDVEKKSSATVFIRSDYMVPGDADNFAYSIIELDNGVWRYNHDESPPRMIIRKR